MRTAYSYLAASDHRLAEAYQLSDIYQTLGERFTETRRALNELGERLVHLSDPNCSQALKLLED